MKKYLILLFMTFACLCGMVSYQSSRNQNVDEMLINTVTVHCMSDGNKIAHGSGVFLNSSEILTCQHVSLIGDSLIVIDCFGIEHTVLKKFESPEYDLAILIIDSKNVDDSIKGCKLGRVLVGDSVYAVGTPLSDILSGSLTKGIVSGIRTYSGENCPTVIKYQSDAAINGGNSGGPLFDEHGNLVGINQGIYSSYMPQWCGISLSISSISIEEFYVKYKNGDFDPITLEDAWNYFMELCDGS